MVQIENFCMSAEYNITGAKKQLIEWEKVFVHHAPFKGLIYRKHKEPLNSRTKRQKL